MLPTVVPIAIPSSTLTPTEPQHDAEPVTMPIAYAPLPYRKRSSVPLFYAFERSFVDSSGAISASEFWNHAAHTWDAPFDASAHVAAAVPMSPAGSPNAGFHRFAVPYEVATERGASVLYYLKDSSGALVADCHDDGIYISFALGVD